MENFNLFLLVLSLLLLPTAFSEMQGMEAVLTRLNSQRASPSVQVAAARGVLNRLLPAYSSSFEFEIVSEVLVLLLLLFHSNLIEYMLFFFFFWVFHFIFFLLLMIVVASISR